MAKAILTQADISLLKKSFATKEDLKSLATKEELTLMEERLKKCIREEVDESTARIVKVLTQDIKLEETLHDHEIRIKQIEEVTPGLPS